MCTSWVIQSAAASFEDGASARVGDQPEQHPLGHLGSAGPATARRAARAGVQAREHGVDAQAAPQRVEDEGAAERAGLAEGQLPARAGGLRVGRIEQPGQRSDQPLDRVPVELIRPAEPVEDLRDRPAGDRVPLAVGQVQVADRAVLGLPRRRLHVHRSRPYTPEPPVSSGYPL
jgi:hypothetical protein